ncbi:ergot alkaloid biosynthesis protein [Sphingobium amiense]|uniref:Ergot alkaloid biosynthesis protein n=1 Tax=Sphingobium amiense TaxID=135719 RepID=A0A494W9C1_9SPHN|nr:ergot alkaloid biosynthesis protein [Sphingobium amiense]BBD99187.1 ergot alkaloid biosynthesis protein [Sphingobium amiense]
MAAATKVLVTGGTGKTGRNVVEGLRERGVACRIAARKPPQTDTGVQFDWMDESSFDAALTDVDGVYLVAPVGVPDPLPVMSTFINRAVDKGVRRFVLLSSSAIPIDGPVLGGVHRFLADNAPEWAVMRPSWFFQNFTEAHHAETIRRENSLYSATGDAAIAFIGAADIAKIAVACLCADQPLNDGVILTGPASHSYDEVAGIISAQAGRQIRHVRLAPQDLARKFTEFGLDEGYAQILAQLDGFLAGGSEARTTDAVEKLTGRPAQSFSSFAAAHKASWKQ